MAQYKAIWTFRIRLFGTFALCQIFMCQNVSLLKFHCVKRSLCQNIQMLKYPCAEKSLCGKVLLPNSLLAKASMETKCPCAEMSMAIKCPCQSVSCQNVPNKPKSQSKKAKAQKPKPKIWLENCQYVFSILLAGRFFIYIFLLTIPLNLLNAIFG